MDYPHRDPERVTTSYPTAIRFSVSGGCPRHRCRATMCCPSPSDDVGNPFTHTADLSALRSFHSNFVNPYYMHHPNALHQIYSHSMNPPEASMLYPEPLNCHPER